MVNKMWTVFKKIFAGEKEQYVIPPLDGAFLPNNAIDRFKVVHDNFKDIDDLVLDLKGNLYLSSDHFVYRLHGKEFREKEIYVDLKGSAGGLNIDKDGNLMACVAGQGVVIVNKGKIIRKLDIADNQPIHCPTAVVSCSDGELFIADGTAFHEPDQWYVDLMEKRSAGRLIRFNPDGTRSEVLLTGLGYPGGLAISNDKKYIIMTEGWNHTVSRYPIQDVRPQTREVLLDNLPGYPGRIITASGGGYWMSFFAMRTHLVEFVLQENKYRKEMMKIIEPAYWIRPALSSGLDFLEPLQAGHAKTLGIMKPWAPPRSYGLIVKLDDSCEIVKSYHCRVDGKRHGITGLCDDNGMLYAVVKGNSLVLRAGREELR